MDQLDEIWMKQESFNRNFVDIGNLSEEKQQYWTKEYVLHLIDETSSLLNEINWKLHHKSDSVKINRKELVLEWIDVFKYWLSIGLIWDIGTDEFLQAFYEKSGIVEQKYLQEYNSHYGEGIVIVDIDGVLSDYPHNFLKFVEEESGKSLLNQPIENINLYSQFSNIIEVEVLQDYKHRYRAEGLSRKELVNEGAQEFLHKLKSKGYYIVVLTSRPFNKYKNLYVDTYMWLKENGLTFDMLLYDDKKRSKILELSKRGHVKFIVDDDPRIVSGLLGSPGKIYLMDKSYNHSINDSQVTRVQSFDEILQEEL